MLYVASQEAPFEIPYHDPDSLTSYGLLFIPETWEAGRVYIRVNATEYDVVLPTTFKGFYHAVSNSGISNATTEPEWAKRDNEETNDFEDGETDGLVWIAKPYNLLHPTEVVGDVEFIFSDELVAFAESFDDKSATITPPVIPADSTARTNGFFTVLARVSPSASKRFDVTLKFNLVEH